MGTDTHRGTQCDNRGRDWTGAAACYRGPWIGGYQQKLRKARDSP